MLKQKLFWITYILAVNLALLLVQIAEKTDLIAPQSWKLMVPVIIITSLFTTGAAYKFLIKKRG